LHPLRHVQH